LKEIVKKTNGILTDCGCLSRVPENREILESCGDKKGKAQQGKLPNNHF